MREHLDGVPTIRKLPRMYFEVLEIITTLSSVDTIA
jgi:hypothetical protein